jgi:solute carrier family 6 (neurotransmitter transporter, GABA) member 1
MKLEPISHFCLPHTFLQHIIGMETIGEDLRPTRVVWQNVGYSAISWILIWSCLAFGLKWTGRIAYVSMGLPLVLLFVFLIKAVTLEGASDGVKAYIGEWDMQVLTDRPDVWSTAVSQVFFSLSVTFGTMTAYGSGCPRGEAAFTNACVVGCSDALFSLIAGFAVFAAMGHLAWQPYAGFGLVFGTWPVVFGKLAGGAHWVRLLFINLFLLGIDSAFSILEAPLTVVHDRPGLHHIPKWKLAGAFAFVAFLLSILYGTLCAILWLHKTVSSVAFAPNDF